MGELLETVELEHKPLVKRLVSWVIRVPKLRPLGVKVYVVPTLGWQGPEEAVGVEVIVPVLHVIRGICRREGYVESCHFFRKVHLAGGRGSFGPDRRGCLR